MKEINDCLRVKEKPRISCTRELLSAAADLFIVEDASDADDINDIADSERLNIAILVTIIVCKIYKQ